MTTSTPLRMEYTVHFAAQTKGRKTLQQGEKPTPVVSIWTRPASTVKGTSVMSGRSVVISRRKESGVGLERE